MTGSEHGDGEIWRNWSGFVEARPERIVRPADLDALAAAIRDAPGPVRIAGTGHSFTPLAQTEGTILSLEHFAGLKAHDKKKLTARLGAGTTIGAATGLLHGVGQALPNMGDIDQQMLGGALGTGTHGSGAKLGAYHTQLSHIQIVDGTGTLREIEAGADDDLLAALGVSLGAFGAVTEVTFRNVESYRLRRRRWCEPIGDVLDRFEALMTGHRSAEFFYIPFSDTALVLASDATGDPATERPADTDDEGLATLRSLRSWLGWAPGLRRFFIKSAMRRTPPQDYVEDWLNVYPTERGMKFNEMEYHLPFEEGAKALKDIIALTEGRFGDVFFPIEVRVVAADEIWLSPFYKRPTCSIAVHHDHLSDPQPFTAAAERIFRRYGGRPHWGKMHNLGAGELRALYPRWDEAMAVRREFDPEGRFVSPYIARLLGVE